jgi:NOL1/NOP2/fmu family ribosome biogenesis protein
MMASLFPGKPLIGEACYWQSDSVLFKNDPAFKNYAHPVTWNDVYNLTYNDAISSHANTLDLREPEQTKRWIDKAPVLVKEFMINGGYRFYPYKLSFPKRIKSDSNFDIVHEWKNTGAGMCPSNNKRWNYKYKVAFALIQKSNMQVKELFIDEKTDPSQWIKGLDYKYLFKGKLDTKIKAGDYILGLAIIDTTNKKPGIQLAIKDLTKLKNGWTEIETIQVSK